MKKQMDKYPKEGRILSNYLFSQYVNKHTPKKDGRYIFTRDDLRHVMKDIFEEIGNQIIESDNGVHMKGMGYFYIFTSITPYFKSPKIAPKKIMYSFADTNGRRFYPCFNPTKGSILKGFSLDFNDTTDFRARVREKARKGKRWKIRLSTFMNKNGR